MVRVGEAESREWIWGMGLDKGGREKGGIPDNYQVCDLHPMCMAVALEILPYSWVH